MGDWQPIDTAPRDGSPVILASFASFGIDYITVAKWVDPYNDPKMAGWIEVVMLDGLEDHCTHWMPLPDPPSENKKAGPKP